MNNKDKVEKIAKYAYQTVPIYNRLAEKYQLDIENAAFEQLPIVDKSYYAETGDSGLSSNCSNHTITRTYTIPENMIYTR